MGSSECSIYNLLTLHMFISTKIHYMLTFCTTWASQVALVVKYLPANAGDTKDAASVPGLGRFPAGGMATHSSILVWKTH